MAQFEDEIPSTESYWRGIILFGMNVASYKFALGKSLLHFAADGKTEVSLGELAVPYSRAICDHLKLVDKQGTPKSSKFLDACRQFNTGEIDRDQLTGLTCPHICVHIQS